MYNNDFTRATKVPAVNTKEFKSLSFKEQLWIYNLLLNDPERYASLIGEPICDKSVEYVDDKIKRVLREKNIGKPEVDHLPPIGFITDHWAAYSAFYNPHWFDHEFSPLDGLGLRHLRVFSFQLFTFPLLVLDRNSYDILTLLKDSPTPHEIANMFYYLVKSRAAGEYFQKGKFNPEVAVALGYSKLSSYVEINDINGMWPIAEPSDIIDLIEDDTYAMLSDQPRWLSHHVLIPLIPTDLLQKRQFNIKHWDFLIS